LRHLRFVQTFLRFDRDGVQRLGHFRHRQRIAPECRDERVARANAFETGDRYDVARSGGRDRLLFFSLQPVHAGSPNFQALLRGVDECRIGRERPGAHAHDRKLAGLWMDDRLRNLRDEWGARIAVGSRELVLDHIEQSRGCDTDIGDAGTDEHRDDEIGARLVVQIFAHFLERRLDAVEQLFEQMIVEIAERLEERLTRFVDGRRELAIDWNFLRDAVRGNVGMAAREVDVSAKLFGVADREMLRNDALSIGGRERGKRRAKIAARLIEFVDEEAVRHVLRIEELDERARLAHAVRIGVDHDDRRIGRHERELHFLEEFDEAGAIDQRKIDVRRRCVRETDAGRLPAIDTFRLVIGRGSTVRNGTAPRNRAAPGEQSFNQGRLARMMRTDDCNVTAAADISHVLPLYWGESPKLEARTPAPVHERTSSCAAASAARSYFCWEVGGFGWFRLHPFRAELGC